MHDAMNMGTVAWLLAAVLGALYAALAAWPARMRGGLLRFPRSRAAAAVLTAIDFAWAMLLLHGTPMGQFEWARRPLYVLVPVLWVVVNVLNDELLAVRALGGLLLLVPAPILAVSRWHPSAWRYVLIVTAYVMVIKGMVLIMSPYVFRRSVARFLGDDGSARRWGGAGLLFCLLLAVAGFIAR